MDLFRRFTNYVFVATTLFVTLIALAVVAALLKW